VIAGPRGRVDRAALTLILGVGGALAACDAPAGSTTGDDTHLAPAGADALVVPSASGERELTAPSDADDLFPALAGDDLVWVRVGKHPEAAAGDVDCLACVGCGQCRWQVMHRRLPDGPEREVWSGSYLAAAPTIDDGLTAFVTGEGLRLVDLASLAAERIAVATNSYGRTPLVRDGLVWWYAWHPPVSGPAFLAYDVTLPGFVATVRADATERWWQPSMSGVAGIARAQPFVVAGGRVVWARTDTAGGALEALDLGSGERVSLLVDSDHVHLAPVVIGDTIVSLRYELAKGCGEAACELALVRTEDGRARELSADARPTIYTSPVADGRRVVWVDKRAGPYMIVGVDIAGDGVERRLSSEDAVVGVVSPPAIDAGRVVWSDRRSGRWRVMMRRW